MIHSRPASSKESETCRARRHRRVVPLNTSSILRTGKSVGWAKSTRVVMRNDEYCSQRFVSTQTNIGQKFAGRTHETGEERVESVRRV